jgi:Family of unknown function (DUF6174)
MRATASSTERAARMHRCAVAVLIIVAALPGVGRAQDADFKTSLKRWQSAALSSYEYGYRKYCECHPDSPPETIVTVRDGQVSAVRHRPVGYDREVPAEAKNLKYYWTVDGLFALLRAAFERGAMVRATYDPAVGYPTSINIDYDADFIGDELDLKITGVTPLAAK